MSETMNETIKLPELKSTSKWLESVNEIDKQDPNSQHLPYFQTYKTSISADSCFLFVFSKKCQLRIFDTYNGILTKLKFVKNNEVLENNFDPSLHEPVFFHPTSCNGGVLFWVNDFYYNDHLNTEMLNRRDFTIHGSTIQLNYNENSFKQVGDGLELRKLNYCWISQLVPGQTVVFSMFCKESNWNPGNQLYRYEMQQFDLDKMEFYGPIASCKHTGLISQKFMTTFYKDCFYDFDFCKIDDQRSNLQRILTWSLILNEFSSVNCYKPGDEVPQKIQLDNNLECLNLVGGRNEVYCDYTWHGSSVYLHVIILKKKTDLSFSAYKHCFAVLSLDTLRWSPILFGNQQSILTSVPMSMSIGNDNQMILVKSFSVLNVRPIINVDAIIPIPPLSLYDKFVKKGGHGHCSAYHVPLRKPSSLQLLTLQSLNTLRPNRKNTKIVKSIQNAVCKPMAIDDRKKPSARATVWKFNGIYCCSECDSIVKSLKHRFKLSN